MYIINRILHSLLVTVYNARTHSCPMAFGSPALYGHSWSNFPYLTTTSVISSIYYFISQRLLPKIIIHLKANNFYGPKIIFFLLYYHIIIVVVIIISFQLVFQFWATALHYGIFIYGPLIKRFVVTVGNVVHRRHRQFTPFYRL